MMTSGPLYPNLYTFIIGHPGVGKTRTIRAASKFFLELPEPHIAPTSMTMASLTDCLVESKRTIIQLPNPPMEYNSMFIMADELSAFMHKYEEDIIGGLTTFYDVDVLPYGQHRRGKEIKIKIKRPQLSILAGSTPSNLVKFIPEMAWDQGFTSRVIMVFSDARIIGDDFAFKHKPMPPEMVHDLKCINTMCGEFGTTQEFRDAVNKWRQAGEPPVPNHPRLTHYNSRRKAHVYKLSMVACVDRGDDMLLDVCDFDRAKTWLLTAETLMPDIFRAGAVAADAKAMEEIIFFIQATDLAGKGVPEHQVFRVASEKVPAQSVGRVLEVMERSGMIYACTRDEKTGLRRYRIGKGDNPDV